MKPGDLSSLAHLYPGAIAKERLSRRGFGKHKRGYFTLPGRHGSFWRRNSRLFKGSHWEYCNNKVNPKLPVVSGKEAIKAFQRIGHEVVRQRGSHVRMRDRANRLHKPLSIPDRKELKPRLLRKLLREANLTVEEFIKLISE